MEVDGKTNVSPLVMREDGLAVLVEQEVGLVDLMEELEPQACPEG